jgi:hypothetical protein
VFTVRPKERKHGAKGRCGLLQFPGPAGYFAEGKPQFPRDFPLGNLSVKRLDQRPAGGYIRGFRRGKQVSEKRLNERAVPGFRQNAGKLRKVFLNARVVNRHETKVNGPGKSGNLPNLLRRLGLGFCAKRKNPALVEGR